MEHLFHLTNCHGEWTVFIQGLTLLSDTFPSFNTIGEHTHDDAREAPSL